MNCDQVREWLELNVGCERSSEVKSHLEACDQCRAFSDELTAMTALLQLPSDSYPSAVDAAELAEATIAQMPHKTKITPLVSWRNLSTRLATAAAVVLVAVGSYWLSNDRTDTEPAVVSDLDYEDIEVVLPESDLQPDDAAIESLYSGLVNVESSMAAKVLLDDLSDDEYEYLEKNFDVGELLL